MCYRIGRISPPTKNFLQIFDMKPKISKHKSRQRDLFRPDLTKMIDSGHGLVKLAKVVNWDRIDEMFGEMFCPDQGRPAISTRLMVSLHFLKCTHNLGDNDVVAAYVENPYWRYLSRMKYFEHNLPIHPSSMMRWRKRIGEAGAEELLKETIGAGLRLKAVKACHLKRVNINTTVQAKALRFSTDARSNDRAIPQLVKAAKQRKIVLRQNDNRLSNQMPSQQIRHAHTKQMKRAWCCTRKLRTYLGGVIRGIESKCPTPVGHLKQAHRRDRNFLKGTVGDRINVTLGAAGINSHKLVCRAAIFLEQNFLWPLVLSRNMGKQWCYP
jgi:IS5 family transposase